ncbi:hypothetical protein ACLMJK_009675 [Lecanora helva]
MNPSSLKNTTVEKRASGKVLVRKRPKENRPTQPPPDGEWKWVKSRRGDKVLKFVTKNNKGKVPQEDEGAPSIDTSKPLLTQVAVHQVDGKKHYSFHTEDNLTFHAKGKSLEDAVKLDLKQDEKVLLHLTVKDGREEILDVVRAPEGASEGNA